MPDSLSNHAHLSIAEMFECWLEHQADNLTTEQVQERWPTYYIGSAFMLAAIVDLLKNGDSKKIKAEQMDTWIEECKQINSSLLPSHKNLM